MRLWIVAAAVQVVILAVLGRRLFQQVDVSALRSKSGRLSTCGLLGKSGFVLASRRVVLPEGMMPAAGETQAEETRIISLSELASTLTVL